MERVRIGAILSNRISERGYKKQDFADMAGISYPTLKKYMNGKVAYNYEILDTFARLLDCSYDYLLGKSVSPRQEYTSVSNQIRLSDEALDILTENATNYENSGDCRRYIRTLDAMIRAKGLIPCIADYMLGKEGIKSTYNATIKVGEKLGEQLVTAFRENSAELEKKLKPWLDKVEESVPKCVIDNRYIENEERKILISLVDLLKDAKSLVNQEFVDELKKYAKKL